MSILNKKYIKNDISGPKIKNGHQKLNYKLEHGDNFLCRYAQHAMCQNNKEGTRYMYLTK